ncbi:hypothetical protein [Enterobacter phage F20]|uniref:Uncharacterized protein n=1 Tax=Enterobacter phage F20 TaxID=2886900 RepID=G5DML1_9CAUD|nr:hypothetical protein FLA17_gp66 [Enterobacter phage F20]AEQ39239.1 hypothetical protein [Enterobacter phage F20]
MNDQIIDLLSMLAEDNCAVIELDDGTELQIEVPNIQFSVSGGEHSARATVTDLDYATHLLCNHEIEDIR